MKNIQEIVDYLLENISIKEKTEMFDEIRNENWKEVFPELVEMLND